MLYPSPTNGSPPTSRSTVVFFDTHDGATVARNRLVTSSYISHLCPLSSPLVAASTGCIGGWSVVLLLPLDGRMLSCWSISSASLANSDCFSFSRMALRLSEGG